MSSPAILSALRGYRRADFFADLGAGLTVGIIALPLAIGFGIASGVTPQQGLWTGIIAGLGVAQYFWLGKLGGSCDGPAPLGGGLFMAAPDEALPRQHRRGNSCDARGTLRRMERSDHRFEIRRHTAGPAGLASSGSVARPN